MIEALDQGFASAEQDGFPPVGLCVSLLRTQTADEATEACRATRGIAIAARCRALGRRQRGRRWSYGASFCRRLSQGGRGRPRTDGPCGRVERTRRGARRDRASRGGSYRPRSASDRGRRSGRASRRARNSPGRMSNLQHRFEGLFLDRFTSPRSAASGGVRISINTDDPSLLGTNLLQEYEIARTSYCWTEDVLRSVRARRSRPVSPRQRLRRS